MNTRKYFFSFSVVLTTVLSTYFAAISIAQQGGPSPAPQPSVNEYQVAAILFQQKAAEYRALAYQAFNLARWQLDADFEKKNLKKLPKAERRKLRAVVVDIDETVLDNSPSQAYLVKQGRSFNPTDWYAWTERRSAKAVPGAVEFLNYAVGRGIKVYYVSNRDEAQKQATIDNLKKVGFRDVSDENVLLRQNGVSAKEPRRAAIAQKYRIVLLMGDNLDDFSEFFERKSVAERFAEADRAKELFGRKFIVLPNAMYGTWENAIYEYQRLTEEQKAHKRASALELP